MSRDSTNNDSEETPEWADHLFMGIGRRMSRYFGGDEGRKAWEEGVDALAPDATPQEIGAAIEAGVTAGMSLVEKRRALREHHRNRAAGDPPAVSITYLEDEDGHTTGARILVSDEDADVAASTNGVAIFGEGYDPLRRDLAFDPVAIDEETTENVTEVIARSRDTTKSADESVEDLDTDQPDDASERELPEFEALLEAEAMLEKYPRVAVTAMDGDDARVMDLARNLEDKSEHVDTIGEAVDVVRDALEKMSRTKLDHDAGSAESDPITVEPAEDDSDDVDEAEVVDDDREESDVDEDAGEEGN